MKQGKSSHFRQGRPHRFYLAEKEVTEGGTQQISYQAVAEVGGKYLVKCYISDVASPGYELMLGMNEEALIKELFSDFRW